MKTFCLALFCLALCGCDVRWPDHAGVMGAPAQDAAAGGYGRTQSSR